jgi:hypothetical protein
MMSRHLEIEAELQSLVHEPFCFTACDIRDAIAPTSELQELEQLISLDARFVKVAPDEAGHNAFI